MSQYFSQDRQDEIVDRILREKSGGFFLDVGAHDGITFSNSYFFESRRGWSGICLEPNPDVFERLTENRSCEVLNAAAYVESVESISFSRCHGYTEMLSGLESFQDPRHRERIERENEETNGKVESIQVAAVFLPALLAERNVEKIDYLSLDIEGGELEVLKTLDYDKTEISIATVENNYSQTDLRQFMESKGFTLIFRSAVDEIYVSQLLYRKEKLHIEFVLLKFRCLCLLEALLLRIRNSLRRIFRSLTT